MTNRDDIDRDALPPINWDRQPLGQMPDVALADMLGVTHAAVQIARSKRGIRPYRAPSNRDERRAERADREAERAAFWQSLPWATQTDTEIANLTGFCTKTVGEHRPESIPNPWFERLRETARARVAALTPERRSEIGQLGGAKTTRERGVRMNDGRTKEDRARAAREGWQRRSQRQ